MIIRTITCHQSTNQGAMLQAYALSKYLKDLGHDVSLIDYMPSYMRLHHRVPPMYNHQVIRQLYLFSKLPEDYAGWKRQNSMKPFLKRFIPTTRSQYRSVEELKANPPVADLYIAGSDQIWNTAFQNGLDSAFYLDFGIPKRRISYAASFATSQLAAGSEDFVKQKLSRFDAISVRETSGKKILETLGYKGVVVVDPVFLLPREQWDTMGTSDRGQERYILTYDFERSGSAIAQVARRLSKLGECKIYSVSPYRRQYAHRNFVNVGPDKFVSLVKHAQCVVSNSFHGSAFAMIYGRNFLVVNRKDGLNVRMQDLLARYGLSHRLITPDAQDRLLMQDIYYAPVYERLEQDIEFSKSFLQNQIELTK